MNFDAINNITKKQYLIKKILIIYCVYKRICCKLFVIKKN